MVGHRDRTEHQRCDHVTTLVTNVSLKGKLGPRKQMKVGNRYYNLYDPLNRQQHVCVGERKTKQEICCCCYIKLCMMPGTERFASTCVISGGSTSVVGGHVLGWELG